ncbi:hypothetical protein APF79_06655 [bacterium BRH_c32]|nr:MAG: hypothetical protein APF79_06655 [bacterium BRH_c32]
MRYRKIGKLDWELSEVGFGGWAIGGDMWGPQSDSDSLKALHKAIDLGVNFIDTAQGYGKGHSEEIIGDFLKERKEELYVATKVPPVSGTKWPIPDNQDANLLYPKEYIIEECEKSLLRLKRDYIDIYQFHTWSVHFNIQDEWFEAMDELRSAGKIRAIGVSVPDTVPDNVIASLVMNKVDTVQMIYNLFEQYPAWNLLPVCNKTGSGAIARVPLDEGALTGKFSIDTKFAEGDVRNYYFRGNNLAGTIRRVEEIKEFVKNKYPEMTLAEFALRFSLSNRSVTTIIPGIRNVEQAIKNSSVSDGNLFSKEELKEMEKFEWRKDFWFKVISQEEI